MIDPLSKPIGMKSHLRPQAILTTITVSLVFTFPCLLQASSPNPDLTVPGAIDVLKADADSSPQYDRSYNLGPTGLRGWIYVDNSNKGQQGLMTDLSRQILVTHVGAGTPALGALVRLCIDHCQFHDTE